MKNVVYLITRNDGMRYVGITCEFNRRIAAHRKSERFALGIQSIEILYESDSYEEIEELESFYIEKYDTYHNGLNESIDGKGNHLSTNFSTRGYKFTKEQKENMKKNHWSKKMKNTWTKHSEETRQKFSETRTGKYWRARKIPRDAALEIIKAYEEDTITFSQDFICKYVKKTDKDNVSRLPIEQLKSPNGKYLNKMKLYSEHFAEKYSVTKEAISQLLKRGSIADDAI